METAASPQKNYRFKISKMDCVSCAATITDTVKRMEGVKDARLNFINETLYVDAVPAGPSPENIIKMIDFAGFGAEIITGGEESRPGRTESIKFKIEGMHCVNCAKAIEKGVSKVKGVNSVTVNFAGESGLVSFDPSATSKEEIFKAVTNSGYTPIGEENPAETPEAAPNIASNAAKAFPFLSAALKTWKNLPEWKKDLYWLIFTFIIAVPAVILTYKNMLGTSNMTGDVNEKRIFLLFILATIVQWTAGLTFYKGAYYSLRSFSSNMDVLVSLGISAAYFYSVGAIFLFKGQLYFDTSVLLILFIRTGKLLEKISKERAAASLKALFKFQPNTANLVGADGVLKEIGTADIKPGDILLVKKGDKIPADGVIIEGQTQIDESMLTGEPVPAEKNPDDFVTGATINNGQVIKMKALRVGKDTVLSRIIRLVEDAQADKAPIQRIADKVTDYFVPVVVMISLLTFISWKLFFHAGFLFALSASIAVLVIACPCAMGLATPMALMVGSSIGLEKGILIKKSSALEEIARINAVVFDKTGTITYGRPEVSDIIPLGGLPAEEILKIAAYGETFSSHPIAAAIVNKFKESKGQSGSDSSSLALNRPENYAETGGLGISLDYEGSTLIIGKKELLERENIDLSKFNEVAEKLETEGKTVIGISMGGVAVGIIAVSDGVKEEAKETVARLNGVGISTYLLTGDNYRSAAFAARQAGIDIKNVIANVLPQEKLDEIKKLKNAGLKVAMVGDGINDAPALAAADVGIAIGSGTDAAKETGDVVLVKSDIKDVYKSVALGRKTLNKVKQNLFWAFFFNGLGIPLAAGVFYGIGGFLIPPAFAGAAMAVSSITVSLNSIALRGYSKKI